MKPDEKKNPDCSETFRYVKPSSAQDCTGLIPAGPVTEKELEEYEELYPFLPEIPRGSEYRNNDRTDG